MSPVNLSSTDSSKHVETLESVLCHLMITCMRAIPQSSQQMYTVINHHFEEFICSPSNPSISTAPSSSSSSSSLYWYWIQTVNAHAVMLCTDPVAQKELYAKFQFEVSCMF